MATKPPVGDQPVMFGTLLASKPKREGRSALGATLTSTVLHVTVIGGLVWATMAVGQEVLPEEVVTLLVPVEEEPPPPPPPPPPPDEIAPPPEVEVARGFLTLAPPDIVLPDIPPPQMNVRFDVRDFSGVGVQGGRADGDSTIRSVTAEDIDAAPTFTPYTVAPELRNRADVGRALERHYPPLLRDAGIGGTVLVWFFIDEEGRVVKTELNKTSGYEALDEAAMRVGDLMRFSPALNRDQKVPVWVALPISFQAR